MGTQSSNSTEAITGGAVAYKDIDFNLIVRTIAPGTPRISTLQGNLTGVQWAVNDALQIEFREFTHEWQPATPVVWHVHIITGALDITDRYVNWEVEYTWANPNSQLPTNTVVSSGDFLIAANTPALTHKIIDISTWTPVAGRIAAHIKPRLKRIVSVGTAPTTDPFCEMLQLHIACDTLGSRQITLK